MRKAINDVISNKSLKAACHQTEKILFIVWYGGHGEMYDGSVTTQVVTNDPDVQKRRFDFEQVIANISRNKNTYIIAVMDCCRVKVENDSHEK